MTPPGELSSDFELPGRLNILLLVLAIVSSCGFLYFASAADSIMPTILFAIGFSFTANTLFSLLHESVHGSFHKNIVINEWGGSLAAAFFPTGLSLQRAFHLTHHRNNRGPAEQFDYLREGDSRFLKYAQWYAILSGVYWVVVAVGALLYALLPPGLVRRIRKLAASKSGVQTSANEYLQALEKLDPFRSRLEVVFSFGVQLVLFHLLNGSFSGWATCYILFAVQWSGLQYADHAFSPLNSHDGVWDLTVNPVSRLFFLNYHYHLAHHRHPASSWITLPSLIDHQRPRPSYGGMWLRMWRGPELSPESERKRHDDSGTFN